MNQNKIPKSALLSIGLLIFVLGTLALAAESGEGAESAGLDEHTLKTIIYQLINVVIIFAGLVYFLKEPMRKAFAKRRDDFLVAADRARRVLEDAERARAELEVRLHKLESTADESLARAKREAKELREQMISEAQNLSNHLRTEAANTAKGEIEKAKRQLREELLQESFKLAEQGLAAKVSSEDHTRLQGEFISNIQAVQR